MKVYLAATFTERERVRQYKDKLFQLGHEVISSWLDEIARPDFLTEVEFKKKLAFKDIVEVYAADLLIQDTEQSSGGKNVELGVAFGQFHDKLIWTVGPPTNVFQELVDRQFVTWEELLKYLALHYKGSKHENAVFPSKDLSFEQWAIRGNHT
jgi:hypothetical protein